MKNYRCKLFNYVHAGPNLESPRDRKDWKTIPVDPFAEVAVQGADMRDAASFAYVLTRGLDRALKMRSLNAPEIGIRAELDIAAIASSLKEGRSPAGPCLFIDWNPCEVFYMIVEEAV